MDATGFDSTGKLEERQKTTKQNHNLVYKKRGEAVNFGGGYETKVTALYAIRSSLDEDVDDVLIASNAKDYGAFDDIVVRTCFKNGSESLHAVQLKHKANRQKCVNFINKKNGDFSLEKYKDSYLKEIAAKLLPQNEDHLSRGFAPGDIVLCLFTNAAMCKNTNNILLDGRTSLTCAATPHNQSTDLDFINTSSNGYHTFQIHAEPPEFTQFLRSYIFTSIQANYENVIRNITAKVEGDNPKVIQNICNVFKKELKSSKLQDFEAVLADAAGVVKKLLVEINPQLLEKTLAGISEYFRKELDSAVMVYNDLPSKCAEYAKFFPQFRFYSDQLDNMQISEAIASRIERSFGEVRPDVTKKFVEYIQDYIQSDRLLTKQQIQFKLLELMLPSQEKNLEEKFQIFKNVTDLSNLQQKLEVLAHIQVSLQGRKAIRLIDVVDPSFCTPEFLLMNMGETIVVGRKLEVNCENYIKRKFYKILLKQEVLRDTRNCIFMIDSCLDQNLMKQLNVVDLTNGQNLPKRMFRSKNYVILISEDDIDKLAKKLDQIKPAHYLKVHESCLEWKKSWGSTTMLNDFVVKNETVEEDDLLKYFRGNINVISSVPGMGKTTILDMLAQHCSSDRWVLRINLNEYNEDLCDRLEEILRDPLEYFYRKIEGDESDNFFCRQLFGYMKSKNAVTVLIDAFDEISPRYTYDVVKLIVELEQLGVYTWMTTRPNAEAYIQERLYLLATDIEGFSNDDIKKLSNGDDRSLSDFYKIPLHLNMLTTISPKGELKWNDDLGEIDVYDHFVTTKCKIYFKKFGINLKRNHVQDMVAEVDNLIRVHQILALLSIYGNRFLLRHGIVNLDEIKELLCNVVECKNHVGLITTVIHGVPIFSHKTYAEYLAAKWLASNLNHKAFKPMYEALFEPSLQMVRFMFDKLVTREYPLHAAVVNKNLELVQQIAKRRDLVMCDQLKRTPLHLCASHFNKVDIVPHPDNKVICEIMNEIVQRFANQKSFLQRLDFLGRDWQQYAIDTRNYNLFYIACYWGCSNIIFYLSGKKFNKFGAEWAVPDNTTGYLSTINSYKAIKYITSNGQVDFLNLLLDSGICNDFQKLATFAIQYRQASVLKLLMRRGFKLESFKTIWLDFLETTFCYKVSAFEDLIGVDVNAKSEEGISALHAAARLGSLEYVKVLTSKGAYIEVTDKWGNTPIDAALKNKRTECVRFFEDFKKQMIQTCNEDLESCERRLGLGSINHKLGDLERKDVVQQMLLSGCTPLCAASFTGHLNAVKEMVEIWGCVNIANSEDESTPLQWAVKAGHLSVVEWLIRAGADVNHIDKYGFTMLHVVLASLIRGKNTLQLSPNNLDMLKLLESKGADVFANREDQDTYLNLAIKLGSLEVVTFFLDCGVNPNVKSNFNGNIPLFVAILWDCFDELYESMCVHEEYGPYFSDQLYYASFLSDSDCYLRITGSYNFSGTDDNINLVRRLIAKGANVNVKDTSENTPLFFAVLTHNFELAKLLVLNGADAILKNVSGRSSFGKAVDEENWEALRLFVENGISVDHRDNSKEYTALHRAVITKRHDMVKYLLGKKAKVNVKVNSQTPLDLALESFTFKYCWDTIMLLVENGANVNTRRNLKGNTALHCAVEEDRLDIVEYLLGKRADVTIRNNVDKVTPLELSRRLKRTSIENFLMQKRKRKFNVFNNFFKKKREERDESRQVISH